MGFGGLDCTSERRESLRQASILIHEVNRHEKENLQLYIRLATRLPTAVVHYLIGHGMTISWKIW